MPTAIYTDENGTDHEYEYTAPDNDAAPFAVDIVESRYIGADGVMALARTAYEGKERWVAYCPSDIPASHHSIVQAHAAGLLTGQTEPTPWSDGRTVSSAKAEKIAAIDGKTSCLITAGFQYGSNRFSMSEAAQRNWIGLGTMASLGMMQYPMPVSTVTEGIAYLQSLDDLRGFLVAFATYQTAPNGPLGSGRALKALVNAAETIEAVDAIEDNR